ncbi:hypothetical protein SDC9_175626 [bioreactor metagenome]|uniref:Uncharacterized protein n=1 Tax=bioreactor metagenome TaxID=1076179 RepID=A0A645GPS3_9ZZZZ
MSNYVINAQAIRVTGSLRGAYMVFIGLLIVNIILISLVDTRKYNKDYMKEEEILSK